MKTPEPIRVVEVAIAAANAHKAEGDCWTVSKLKNFPGWAVDDEKRKRVIIDMNDNPVSRSFETEDLARAYVEMRKWVAAVEAVLNLANIPAGELE